MYRLQIFNLNSNPVFIAVTLAVGLSIASAATPVIGFVNVKGMVQIDASPVAGHGTLFEGSTVETGIAGSQLEVPQKASLYLASASRAKIFADHMILERGDSELSGSAGYWMEARGLQIGSVESAARARVSLRGNKQVMVAAVSGPVRVENGRGVLVAWVAAGRTLEFEPQDGATTPGLATLTGCLQKIDGHYILTDSTTGVKVELNGARAAEEAGNNVTGIWASGNLEDCGIHRNQIHDSGKPRYCSHALYADATGFTFTRVAIDANFATTEDGSVYPQFSKGFGPKI